MEINKQDVTIYVVDDEFSVRDSLAMLLELEDLKLKATSLRRFF